MERDKGFQFLVGLKPKFDLPMINVRHRTISISGWSEAFVHVWGEESRKELMIGNLESLHLIFFILF